MRAAWAMTAVLCAGAARAQDRAAAPPPPPQREEARKAPLSPEDAELVKELAVLERLELLRNLELFEQEKEKGAKPTKDERPQ